MFELKIGLENQINSEYDPIIWFPLGNYVVNSFSINCTASNITVSISG
jgi:hypothetical protein